MLIPFSLLLYADSFPKIEVYGGTIPQFFTQQNQSCTAEEGVLLSDSQSDGFFKQIQTYKTLKKNDQKNYFSALRGVLNRAKKGANWVQYVRFWHFGQLPKTTKNYNDFFW